MGFRINVELKYMLIKIWGGIVDLRCSRLPALKESARASTFHHNVIKDVFCNL